MEMTPIHRILLALLCDFDRFCRTHEIVYYLAGGTLLGAVREGGFIPWDDDADVMMTRENYEKLLSVRHALPPHLFLQCRENDALWHYPYAKLRVNGTVHATAFSRRFPTMHQGVFLDIFVQNATADTPRAARRHAREIRFWRAMVRWCWHRDAGATDGLRTAKPIRWAARFCSLDTAEACLSRAMRRYETRHTATRIDSSGMHLQNGGYPDAWLGTPRYLPFEGELFPVPADPHAYLTYLYGDYRTPVKAPPHGVE